LRAHKGPMTVLELKGYKSLRALNAYSALMLGLKMIPEYMTESYEEFLARLDDMPEADQKKMIQKAALFVTLSDEEVQALVCFCADKNGVPYSKENLKSLGPKELVEIIVAVCGEIAKIKIDFLTDSEKKN
jgi:hypothetical protein